MDTTVSQGLPAHFHRDTGRRGEAAARTGQHQLGAPVPPPPAVPVGPCTCPDASLRSRDHIVVRLLVDETTRVPRGGGRGRRQELGGSSDAPARPALAVQVAEILQGLFQELPSIVFKNTLQTMMKAVSVLGTQHTQETVEVILSLCHPSERCVTGTQDPEADTHPSSVVCPPRPQDPPADSVTGQAAGCTTLARLHSPARTPEPGPGDPRRPWRSRLRGSGLRG